MAFEAILAALADPTRRAILDRIRGGPMAVGEIAKPLPVSRPAVSQHLKVMLDAGLVTMTRTGRRNLYSLAPGGAAPLVEWLGALSTRVEVLAEAGLARSVTVRLSPAEARQLFCEDLALWWPVAVVSLSAQAEGALPQAVVLDAVAGGLWREVLYDGSEGVWGTVLAASETALTIDWRLGTPEGSRLVIRFDGDAAETSVRVLHDADTPEMAELWTLVLVERFAAAAASSLSNF